MLKCGFRNLGNNVFPRLPSAGLERLLILKTFNNPFLREFPPPEDFPRIQTLVLSYAYHCCAFLPLIPSNPPPKAKDIIVVPDINDIDISIWNSSSLDLWPSQGKNWSTWCTLQWFRKFWRGRFNSEIKLVFTIFGTQWPTMKNLWLNRKHLFYPKALDAFQKLIFLIDKTAKKAKGNKTSDV